MAAKEPAPPPESVRPWPQMTAWLSYALPLLAFSWAIPAGVEEAVVALTAVLVALTHRFLAPLTTSFLLLGLGQAVSLANAEKIRDTGDAILWQDLIHAAPNVTGNLGTFWQYVGFSGLAIGAVATCLLVLVRMLEIRCLQRSQRVGAGFTAVTLLLYFPAAAEYLGAVTADLKEFRQSPKSFAGNLYTHSLARFLHSATLEPANFQSAGSDPDPFRKAAAQLKAGPPPVRAEPFPDIFVILNESQFDPSGIAECHPPADCRMAVYATHGNALPGGPLKVHTHGWGTWNAEFTLMTGVPYFWFGETGFYSAYTTAPRIRLALGQHLASLGYRTIGIYPTQKGMLNAARAYRHYGIAEFLGAEDLGLSYDWCSIPDRLMYEKLLERYRAARGEDGRPIFMVMLTVFNHGPHGQGCMDPDLANTLGKDAPPRLAKLADYLHRSKAADAAATGFRDTLLAGQRPRLLLFAGDHQPSFEGLASSYPRRTHRPMPAADAHMFTNYRFFANYQGPVTPDDGQRDRELDISFLAATLLELAMLPLGPLFEPNLQLRDLCRGRLDSCPPSIVESYKSHLKETGFYQ